MTKEMIRFIRNLYDYTQRELADRLGYSETYIIMIENGHKRVTQQFIKRLMTSFGLTTNDIIRYKELYEQIKKGKECL